MIFHTKSRKFCEDIVVHARNKNGVCKRFKKLTPVESFDLLYP